MKTKWAIAVCLVLSMALIPSALAGASQTFVVQPTGIDDTANLQAAFDAATAVGSGSVVELAAGDFYLSEPILIDDFSGTFRGQGSSTSVIHMKPNTLFGLLKDPPFDQNELGVMFYLTYHQDGAVLRWESMGFDLVGKTEPWHHAYIPEPYWMDFLWPIWIEGMDGIRHVDSVWWDVRVKGDAGDYAMGFNAASVLSRYLSGTHRITNCHFDTMDYGFFFGFYEGAQITIGGPRPQDQVTFHNVHFGVFDASDVNSELQILNARAWSDEGAAMEGLAVLQAGLASGLKVRMSGVETDRMSAALLYTHEEWGCAATPSTYVFEHNTIRQAPGTTWAGFEIHETCPVKSHIVIRNNRISGEGSFLWGPIFTEGAQGAVITNNQITGSGPAAMYLGPWTDDSGLMVKGNNVQGWTVDASPCGEECMGLPLAPIWLGPGTSGNTVAGSGDLRTNVFDETDDPSTPEYDGANILVGVNSQGAHIGQAIRDAMQARIAAKKLFMSKGPY